MTLIKTQNTNRVFRRIHDGFIMGKEIVLGKDYSTGIEREDLPEYYEEVLSPYAPTPPTLSGNKVAIPEYWHGFFKNDKFVVGAFVVELERIGDVLAVDVAWLHWKAFQEELDKPENAAVKHMEVIWDYILTQEHFKNFV